MKTHSVQTMAARMALAVLTSALIGCGGGGSGDSATAVSPGSTTAPNGTSSAAGSDGTASNTVPGNTGDSATLFMAFLKMMMTPNDDSSDSWTIPALKDAGGDDTAEPVSAAS